ncbi:MarR family winged helix-turn-helix transcriptional regulator [Arthrobacter sp. RIT-PI-e]|uniref:MarR family winged helix-turn-helix transcriptional regulator n=1 Tax=Arthrobacter sp. RIT-PI-e TaxID=1681197 RepID=UPI000675EE5D|nr:MarR family transcriptional regulator [Arthrobacter sp. RIT-PI-e]
MTSTDTPAPFASGPEPTPAGHGPATGSPAEALVDAVRRYRNAETAMRGRSRDSMHLGRTDMAALRFLFRARQTGRPLNAAELARSLEISTAATTVLIDRLVGSGHAERHRSATDGRAIEIRPTASSDSEVRSTMGVLHERMMEVAGALSAGERRVVHAFLVGLGIALSDLDVPDTALEGV